MLPQVCLCFAFAIAMSCVCHCFDLPTPPAVLALQVPCVVSEAKAALEEGFAVVIGLQTTGEAAADQLKLAPGAFYGEFISPTKQCMRLFVEQNFPVRTPAKSPQKGQKGECLRPPGTCCRLFLVLLQHTVEAMLGPIKSCRWAPSHMLHLETTIAQQRYCIASTTDHQSEALALLPTCSMAAGEPGPEIDTCVRMRNDLLEQIDSLELPANFLDALIDQLGGPGQCDRNGLSVPDVWIVSCHFSSASARRGLNVGQGCREYVSKAAN